jgi:K+ transporter
VAIFLSSYSQGVPFSLSQLTSHIPYMPEIVIFTTIRYLHTPYVKQWKHAKIEALPEKGFYRVVGEYGYRESQVSMDQLFNECASIMPEVFHNFELSDAAFFLSTEHVRIDKSRKWPHKIWIKIFKYILQVNNCCF